MIRDPVVESDQTLSAHVHHESVNVLLSGRAFDNPVQ